MDDFINYKYTKKVGREGAKLNTKYFKLWTWNSSKGYWRFKRSALLKPSSNIWRQNCPEERIRIEDSTVISTALKYANVSLFFSIATRKAMTFCSYAIRPWHDSWWRWEMVTFFVCFVMVVTPSSCHVLLLTFQNLASCLSLCVV